MALTDKRMLLPYMGYSRIAGPQDGAILIFAHTAREARKLAYPSMHWDICDDWLDAKVRRLKDEPWLYQDADQAKLAAGEPHVIMFPSTCRVCETWGNGPLKDGLCEHCKELMDDEVGDEAG